MSQGVSGVEKPKIKGRGRGMARKTSQDSNGSNPSEGTEPPGIILDNKADAAPSSSEKTRETKVRRTKAGYEPYQVKKKLSISLSESKSPTSSKTSSGKGSTDTRSKSKSTEESKKHSSHKSHHTKDSQQKKSHHNKPRQKQDQKQPDDNVIEESINQKLKFEDAKDKKEMKDPVKTMSAADEQKLKEQTLGLSILECPCMLSDGCNGCSPHASKETSPVIKTESKPIPIKDPIPINTINTSEEQKEPVIDTKFLVASPRIHNKEKSVLDSDNEEQGQEQNLHTRSECMAADTISDNDKTSLSHKEINAMFGRVNLDSDSYNSETRVPEEGNIFSRTDSVSSSSDNGSNLKVSELGQRKKNDNEGKHRNTPKQRNILSSIHSILNENKTFDSKTKPITRQQQSATDKHTPKEDTRKSGRGRNENRKKARNSKKDTAKKSQSVSDEIESSKRGGAGLLALPTNYQDQNQQNIVDKESGSLERHVHFGVEGKPHTDVRMSPSKSSKDENVKQNLKVIESKQREIKSLLEKPFKDPKVISEVLKHSEVIQHQYGELIVFYQEYAFRHDFESALWKSAFHNIISKFRELLENHHTPKDVLQVVGDLYWKFLQNGIQFLDELVEQLQEQANFNLEEYLEDPIRMSNCGKHVKLALRSCHLLLIYVGDLERYISSLQQENNYSQAQSCYNQAQMLAPKNGKSYNQLAVVAVLTKRKLDAVYYYTRSLLASNPIMTARDRLTSIFHEIQRKAYVFKQRYPSHPQQYNFKNEGMVLKERAEKLNPNHLRDEIWIFIRHNHMFKVMLTDNGELVYLTPPPKASLANSHPSLKHSKSGPKQDKLSLSKINRGFTILFLFIHCKLYTNIGLEDFMSVHEETLSYFKTLLQYPKASSVKGENILKYMAINIFSIHALMNKNQGGSTDVIANTGLDFALMFALDMFGVLCTHCSKLMSTKGHDSVDQFLPAARVWLLWMVDHSEWIAKSTASSMMDIWTELCSFFNLVMEFEISDTLHKDDEASKNAYLSEDIFLAGFKPFSSKLLHLASKKGNEHIVCRLLRMTSLKEMINKLDETGFLPFAYDEKEKTYKAIQATRVFTSPIKQKKEFDEEVDDGLDVTEDVILEDSEDEDAIMNESETSHLNELKAQKADLARQVQENEEKRQKAMAILEVHKSKGRHISENSPSYLVLDTNCFIDCLQHIVTILDSKDFNVVVPLIVINELDGLKKGSYAIEQDRQNYRNIQECARQAVDVLEDRFSAHDPNIRAITSSGNELSTIAFRVEELSSDRGTNDDVILSCCLKYCKEHISYEGASKIVHRDVVLLTNDRNLRLKAHSRNVPTVPLPTFMKMAQFV